MVGLNFWDNNIILLIEAHIQLVPDDKLYCGRAMMLNAS